MDDLNCVLRHLTTTCNLNTFHIQLADDTTCAVGGETYNPSTKRCQCGSESSCTFGDKSGKLWIVHQYWFILQLWNYILFFKHCIICVAYFLAWRYLGIGFCDNTVSLGTPTTLDEAKSLMTSHEFCSKPGSILIYSEYSYSWGAKCTPSDQVSDCIPGTMSNWKRYLLQKSIPLDMNTDRRNSNLG